MPTFDRRQLLAGGLLAGGLLAAGATTGRAADPDPELVRLWGELGTWDDERATLALLKLAGRPPAELIAFARERLQPVALTTEQADKLLADALGDDGPARDGAFRALADRNPRLVYTVDEVWAKAAGIRDRQRLARVLLGTLNGHDHLDFTLRRIEADGGKGVRYNLHFDWLPGTPAEVVAAADGPKLNRGGTVVVCDATAADLWGHPNWKRAANAVLLMEHLGTPEAVAYLRELAAGHPDARATVAAKRALERIGKRD